VTDRDGGIETKIDNKSVDGYGKDRIRYGQQDCSWLW
jgi:hypothetical protein